jgi:glycosyltransferase XagB
MNGLMSVISDGRPILIGLFVVTQVLYLASILLVAFFYSRPVDLVRPADLSPDRTTYPPVLLLYPVLRELEQTMRTTFCAIDKIDYPRDRFRIVAIPNHDDYDTIAALERLQREFSWLEILDVPATSDPTWNVVWEQWENNPKVYWWHSGKRAGVRALPPKKTRQLIYAFYNLCPPDAEDTLISYIDADSAPPPNYFLLGAAGASKYDVVQLTNVAGNVLSSWASSFHSFDHMCWDVSMYAHMTAHGKHPFYVLGKGLFFRSSDLHAFGGFHPWLTIEDPEVGMRLWTNGRRLGVVAQPLIEEVPRTFRLGVIQRKRWVCGFFQSLADPLKQMGMTRPQRFRARLNLVPCLSLLVNPIGIAVGIWVLGLAITGDRLVSRPLALLSAINILGVLVILTFNWFNAWKVSRLVLDSRPARLRLALRLNPLFVLAYWIFWSVSIFIGLQMFIRDKGLVWERTEKVDANHDLVRVREFAGAGGPRVRVLDGHAAADRITSRQYAAGVGLAPPRGTRTASGPAPGRARPSIAHAGGVPTAAPTALDRPLGRHRRTQHGTDPRHAGALAQRQWQSTTPSADARYDGRNSGRVVGTGSVDRALTEHRLSQLAGLEALCAISESKGSHRRNHVDDASTVPFWMLSAEASSAVRDHEKVP